MVNSWMLELKVTRHLKAGTRAAPSELVATAMPSTRRTVRRRAQRRGCPTPPNLVLPARKTRRVRYGDSVSA
jgi:hypothetical protein